MPFVSVMMYPRSHEKKARLAKAITDAVVEIAEVSPDAVSVVFRDVTRDNWAVGGILASDRKE